LSFDIGGHGACLSYGSSCSTCVLSLKFVGHSVRKIWHTFDLGIHWPGNLDLWQFTLKLMRFISRGQTSYRFWCFRPFVLDLWANNTVKRIMWPCDLDLWHWRWQRLLIRFIVPHLYTEFEVPYVGLRVRKILHNYYELSITRPGGLDLWPFNFETGAIYYTWNLQQFWQFRCFWDFSFSTYGATAGPRDLATCALTLAVMALVDDLSLRAPSMYHKFEIHGPSFQKILHIYIVLAIIGLVTRWPWSPIFWPINRLIVWDCKNIDHSLQLIYSD